MTTRHRPDCAFTGRATGRCTLAGHYCSLMPRLVVVLPLVPLHAGDGFPLKTWPLHVTVAPPFGIDADAAAVAAVISPVLAGVSPLQVTAGPDRGFGPSARIPVTVLLASPELSALHLRLLDALTGVQAEFEDPQYIGPVYCAHVTMTAGARMTPGEVALLEQAALVDMEPVRHERLRHVVWTAALAL